MMLTNPPVHLKQERIDEYTAECHIKLQSKRAPTFIDACISIRLMRQEIIGPCRLLDGLDHLVYAVLWRDREVVANVCSEESLITDPKQKT